MNYWYYIENRKSVDPFTESEFLEKVRRGIIQAKTLVWNPGLPFDWIEYGTLTISAEREASAPVFEKKEEAATSGNDLEAVLVPGDECNRLFRRDELIQRDTFWVCADCNPHYNWRYLNQLKSMRSPRCEECGREALHKDIYAVVVSDRGGAIQVCADCRPRYLWFYKDEQDNKIGPLKEEKFIALAQKGVIRPATPVWNPRMFYGWVKYQSLGPDDFSPSSTRTARTVKEQLAPDQGRCLECGRIFPSKEMIPFHERFVCVNCKPVFQQKLKEGLYRDEPLPVVEEMQPAGFWIRFGAYVIDSLILYLINIPIGLLAAAVMRQGSTAFPVFFLIQGQAMLFGYLAAAVYEILLVGKYGATVGKMVFRLRVVTADRKPVTYLRSLGRHFAKYLSGLICAIGYIMIAFDNEKREICGTRVICK